MAFPCTSPSVGERRTLERGFDDSAFQCKQPPLRQHEIGGVLPSADELRIGGKLNCVPILQLLTAPALGSAPFQIEDDRLVATAKQEVELAAEGSSRLRHFRCR